MSLRSPSALRAALALRVLAAAGATLASGLATSAGPPRGVLPAHRAIFIRTGELTLRGVRAGDGDPIVLLHGYGESLLSWSAVFDLLAPHVQVLALDLPGFGLSSKPPSGYSPAALARSVASAMTTLGIERALLVGHSLGGAVAAEFTVRFPKRTTGLVLLDAPILPSKVLERARTAARESASAAMSTIALYETWRARLLSPHDATWLAEPDSAMSYDLAADPAYRQALRAVLAELDVDSLAASLRRLPAVPILLVWGELDATVPLEHGDALAAALPDARLLVVRRAWHRPHVEQPRAVARAILAFQRWLARPAVH